MALEAFGYRDYAISAPSSFCYRHQLLHAGKTVFRENASHASPHRSPTIPPSSAAVITQHHRHTALLSSLRRYDFFGTLPVLIREFPRYHDVPDQPSAVLRPNRSRSTDASIRLFHFPSHVRSSGTPPSSSSRLFPDFQPPTVTRSSEKTRPQVHKPTRTISNGPA